MKSHIAAAHNIAYISRRMTKLLSFLLFLLGFVLANGFASSSSSSSSTTGATAASLHHQRVTSSSATTPTASSRTISSTCSLDSSSSASVEELSSSTSSSSANHHRDDNKFVVSRENWELLSRRARSALSRLIRHDATSSSRGGQQLHVYGDWPCVGVDDELKIRLGEQVRVFFFSFWGEDIINDTIYSLLYLI